MDFAGERKFPVRMMLIPSRAVFAAVWSLAVVPIVRFFESHFWLLMISPSGGGPLKDDGDSTLLTPHDVERKIIPTTRINEQLII